MLAFGRCWRLVLALALFPAVLSSCRRHAEDGPPVPRPADFIRELWYKNSFIYSLDVKVFKDSDGDGVGDFRGLRDRVDYLKALGVDVIWLAPFQPSPNQDDGYDITDFFGIDPRLGTKEDFAAFMRAAHARNIRVMMDLVVDHTSNRHPWFQEARSDKNSPYHTWYSWSHERPKNWDKGMVFPGVQKETWTLDAAAGEYYFHRFYDFQPTLNTQNPAVLGKIREIMRYWTDQGIAGFRIDAVPFLIEVRGSDPDRPEHQFALLDQLHQYVQWHRSDAALLGEANVEPKEDTRYFGADGQGMQMMFNFWVNQHLFYALASGDVQPLVDALQKTRDIPPTAQWAMFLRNHDEIDLGRLTARQRQTVFDQFGPAPDMQLYHRGIRRRLAPMLGDSRRIEMAYSLLFSLPGAPVLRYGEEIGMGDDLSLKERESIRTPMQWSGGPNAGFSSAAKTIRPVIERGPYGFGRVNATAEGGDPRSLLNRIAEFARIRKACPEIGWGTSTVIDVGSPHVLALRYDFEGRSVLVLHNFSREPQTVPRAALGLGNAELVLGTTAQSTNSSTKLDLSPYGYAWFRNH